MGLIGWAAVGVLVGLGALASLLAGGRRSNDLGSVSGSWISEHRETKDRDA